MKTDADYMRLALEQARRAASAGEVPVGATLVLADRVIACAANRPISACDPTAHAEIEACAPARRCWVATASMTVCCM